MKNPRHRFEGQTHFVSSRGSIEGIKRHVCSCVESVFYCLPPSNSRTVSKLAGFQVLHSKFLGGKIWSEIELFELKLQHKAAGSIANQVTSYFKNIK